MLHDSLQRIIAPFVALSIVIIGHGLSITFTTVSMHKAGFTPLEIGMVSSMYYLGLVAGSFKIERFVVRVGHIRAYAAFASIFTAASIMLPMWQNGFFWGIIRLIYGYCVAGLFVVIESWFLTASEPKSRGQILSLYMISYYGAYSIGQYILKLEPYIHVNLFVITALLGTISVIPLATTRISSPVISEPEKINLIEFFKISPSSMIGGFSGGLYTSVVLSLLPIYISVNQYSHWVPYLMAILIIGGMVAQYPVGRLSDYMDRRKILLVSFAISGFFSLFCYIENPIESHFREVIFFCLGAFTSVLYPISISLMCDNVGHNRIIAATQGMLLSYSIGCVLGPILAPLFGDQTQIGIFLFMSLVSFFSIIAITLRIVVSEPVPAEEKQQYVPAAPIQTASAPELSPNIENQEDSVYEQC